MGIIYRTYRNDDDHICCTVVVEELVICTDLRIHPYPCTPERLQEVHRSGRVGSLTSLEEDIRSEQILSQPGGSLRAFV